MPLCVNLSCGWYYILPYRVRGDRIEILRVLHVPSGGRSGSEARFFS